MAANSVIMLFHEASIPCSHNKSIIVSFFNEPIQNALSCRITEIRGGNQMASQTADACIRQRGAVVASHATTVAESLVHANNSQSFPSFIVLFCIRQKSGRLRMRCGPLVFPLLLSC